jgi:CRISPR-associated protein Cas1
VVSEAQRTYWLTTPCRVRRERQSLAIERADGSSVHIPVTDVRDLVALAPVDVNTAAVSLLARHGIALHLLDEYGNYAGQLAPADGMCAGEVVRRQVITAEKPAAALAVARELVLAAAHNVRWAFDTSLLAKPLATLERSVQAASTGPELMAAEGTFRRSSWSLLDEELPPWLLLHGRSRRPPRNAGNAFISFTNGIVYSRALTALRLTPLHSGIGFLHATMARHRHTLALDLAEPFKPLLAERLLRRAAHQRILRQTDFEVDVAAASLSATGRKRVVGMVRDELAETVYHRRLRRRVSYEGLIRLEALKLVRLCLEGEPYKAFRAWW